jgi:hypothetical protein
MTDPERKSQAQVHMSVLTAEDFARLQQQRVTTKAKSDVGILRATSELLPPVSKYRMF